MDDRPIALVHGLASSFEHGWRSPGWIDLLSDAQRDVIPVDILGHGTADKPHDPNAYADLENSVERALPDEQIDAVGFSMGAQLLLRIASKRPERFGRLVVIGVGANLFRDDDFTKLAEAFESGTSPDDITARLFVQLSASAGNDPLAIAACLRRPRRAFTKDELANITCSTLVVLGDRDFAGPADPLMEALPNAELRTLPGVDHFRSPSEFACIDATLDYLGAVP